ncbi:MAG: hypothetical protein MJ187_02290 [Alphaproteobacteria bacterium]|nr:hypothetical protein [Alphaproteobacteria bacterium]
MKITYKKVVVILGGITSAIMTAGCVDVAQEYVVTNKGNNTIKIKETGIGNHWHEIKFANDTNSLDCYNSINVNDTIRGKWFIRLCQKMNNTVFMGNKNVNVISHVNGRVVDQVTKQRR